MFCTLQRCGRLGFINIQTVSSYSCYPDLYDFCNHLWKQKEDVEREQEKKIAEHEKEWRKRMDAQKIKVEDLNPSPEKLTDRVNDFFFLHMKIRTYLFFIRIKIIIDIQGVHKVFIHHE